MTAAAVPARSETLEHLHGLIERVTFHNAESGFCVLRVKVRGQRDLVTVVGHAATIAAGEWVQMRPALDAADGRNLDGRHGLLGDGADRPFTHTVGWP